MKELTLILEKSGNDFLGRVFYKENLILGQAETLKQLEVEIRTALFNYHELQPELVKFRYKYDLSALFEKFAYLKISAIAKAAAINASLLRQYVNGQKQASEKQANKIQTAIHQIAIELSTVEVYGK